MMNTYTIDLAGARTLEQIHDRIAEGMHLPEWYGRNLDAFHDVLTEMNGRVFIRGFLEADDDLDVYLGRLRMVITDSQKENPLLEIIFE